MNNQALLVIVRDLFINTASVQVAVLIYLPSKVGLRKRKNNLNYVANTIFSLLLISLSVIIESNL